MDRSGGFAADFLQVRQAASGIGYALFIFVGWILFLIGFLTDPLIREFAGKKESEKKWLAQPYVREGLRKSVEPVNFTLGLLLDNLPAVHTMYS